MKCRMLSTGVRQTVKIAETLGKRIRPGGIVLLYGDLGAGKTVFVKGIASALGIDEREISSASFLIAAEHGSTPPFYHIDLYRLDTESDIENADVYEYLSSGGICVVEWAEKLSVIPAGAVKVHIKILSEDEREIIIEGNEDWANESWDCN